MDIDAIIKDKEAQVADEKLVVSPEEMKERASAYHRIPLDLGEALNKDRLALIAPLSKASPETRTTRHRFKSRDIGREYEKEGYDALLVCTETTRYLGQTKYVEEARENAHIPIIMHDVVIDPYQIYQALILGADAVVLMTSALSEDALIRFSRVAEECGLQWVVQVETPAQMQSALQSGTRFVMIRNENGSMANTEELAGYAPDGVTLISQGAAKSLADFETLASWGANAVAPVSGSLQGADVRSIVKRLESYGPPAARAGKPVELKKEPESSVDFPSLKDVP